MRVMFEVPFVEGQRRPHFTVRGGRPHAYKDDHDRALERTIAAAYTEAGVEMWGCLGIVSLYAIVFVIVAFVVGRARLQCS